MDGFQNIVRIDFTNLSTSASMCRFLIRGFQKCLIQKHYQTKLSGLSLNSFGKSTIPPCLASHMMQYRGLSNYHDRKYIYTDLPNFQGNGSKKKEWTFPTSSELYDDDVPVYRKMRSPSACAIDSRSLYNGSVSKDVVVVKSRNSGFRFVPLPRKFIDPNRQDHLHQYRGTWYNGVPDGKGRLSFPNGNVFYGAMYDGRCEGEGIEKFESGVVRYVGEWGDNKPKGLGRMTLSKGAIYTGEFKDGSKEGYGCLQNGDGSSYLGSWAQNKMHGLGIITTADGQTEVVYHRGGIQKKTNDSMSAETISSIESMVAVITKRLDVILAFANEISTEFDEKDEKIQHYQNKKTSHINVDKGAYENKNSEEENGNDVESSPKAHTGGKKTRKLRQQTATATDSLVVSQEIPVNAKAVTWKKQSGSAVINYSDGSSYSGWVVNGLRHGTGTLLGTDGKVLYKGKWSNDERKVKTVTKVQNASVDETQ